MVFSCPQPLTGLQNRATLHSDTGTLALLRRTHLRSFVAVGSDATMLHIGIEDEVVQGAERPQTHDRVAFLSGGVVSERA